uniref:tRNA(Ile)-lysidine synthase, chloroplastic n=1 Tax=Chloropicon primus TaxID=1764295 RepID=A0A088CIN7_9CHLO|nr:hypothetical chloroplast RF62 [Chloropicon primus]
MSIKRILYVLNKDIFSEQKKELNLLVALSGGQDSTCLIFFIILFQRLLFNEKQIRIGIIHCQHNWNIDSLNKPNYLDAWLTLLKKLNVKVTFYSSIPSIPLPTEAKSRHWRLNLFNRVAKKYNYNFILTGHTLNDEVETFLMQQVIRGFFNPQKKTPLQNKGYLQPLTWIHRNEILDICSSWQLPLFADSTNQSILLPRSRVRLELFSILKAFYNPQIENSLKQTIQIQKEKNYLSKDNEISIHLFCYKNRIVLNRLKLNQLPLIKQKQLWRQCFEVLGAYNIGFYWIEKCLFYSQIKKQFIFYFIKNIQLEGSANWLVLSKNQN